MIKIENVSTVGWEVAIRGARNPMNSWDKSDTMFLDYAEDDCVVVCHDISGVMHRIIPEDWSDKLYDGVKIGPNDLKLLSNLAKAGSDEAKFRRMIVVYVDITAPMYWWKEADTYKVGTVRNSCSTMHKIHAKKFTLEDFSYDHIGSAESELQRCIDILNIARGMFLRTKDKAHWWSMIQLLPSSYNQRATLMLNYEVLANMYHARKNHKLDEWHDFCAWVETLPYAKELIVDAGHEDTEDQLRARFKSYENQIEYLEITMAKELYSRGMSTLDISEKIGIGESTIRKIVEENKS